VHVQEVTNEIAEALRLDVPRGALISGIDPRGPAGPDGMRTGDVIVSFNGRDVRNARELPRIAAEAPVGTTVPVTVVRDGRSEALTVTLGLRESNRTMSPDPLASVVSALGMQLSSITPALRNQLELRDDARGVVVIAVNSGSPAAAQGIRTGTVIAEVHNTAVDTPGDFVRRVETLRAEGRRSAVFLVLAANGQMRFIALDLS
jgi:serine protease Do